MPAKVVRKPEESLDNLYKRFKRMVIKEGTIQELRSRTYYISKGEKRRLKHKAAVKRAHKKAK